MHRIAICLIGNRPTFSDILALSSTASRRSRVSVSHYSYSQFARGRKGCAALRKTRGACLKMGLLIVAIRKNSHQNFFSKNFNVNPGWKYFQSMKQISLSNLSHGPKAVCWLFSWEWFLVFSILPCWMDLYLLFGHIDTSALTITCSCE